MSLRAKLLLAQTPVLLALVVVSAAGGYFLTDVGRSARTILQDNYRSVLAAQRMKESVEAMDSAALLRVAGREPRSTEPAEVHRRRFEDELRTQEGNITEPGEEAATGELRRASGVYLEAYGRFEASATAEEMHAVYFDELLPAFAAVKEAANVILALNQDAMARKSDAAERRADRSVTLLVVVSLVGFVLAWYASATLTGRLLRPVSVLAQAARRLGEGDLAARARVEGADEIARLAADFNAMADRLQKYRDSSLGELLEAQRVAQAAIDSLPDPVVVLSVEGHLQHVNRAAETMLRASLEGGPAALDPAVRAIVERVSLHVGAGKGAYLPRGLEEAIRVPTPDGERDLLPRATPVYGEQGEVVSTSLVLQDVTRLLRFEELRNDLIATVAHEFRTPLTSLRMAVHLLTEQEVGPLNERQADLVYAAREECDRLQSIVDDLLDLSRIQSGRMELRRVAAEPEELVREAIEAQQGLAAQRKVRIRSEALPGIGRVLVDPERIQLVFTNLLLNAVRHSAEGGTVIVRAIAVDGRVRIEVSDAGPGIPPEFHQAIFGKFFQMPGAPGGAGLGLFIAKEIVQAHGGRIGVESEPGRGSTFWFELAVDAPRLAA